MTRELHPEPFRIEPTFSPRIWGARSLAPLFPDKTNLSEPIGEAWLTDVNCRVATGPFAGKTLGEAWREMPEEWRGSRVANASDFPLLVKFIFPTDKLSIQVHPDDAYASVHEKAAGGRGKTEMWHAVSAQPGAQVLIGLKPGVTKEKFLAASADQTLEDCFVRHEVHAGDTFFIPAGTPHTIGPGMVLCEVQQYSDLTYRVYDYGRLDSFGKQRELHVEKALDVIHFGDSKMLSWQSKHPMDEVGTAYVYYLAACRYFLAERWEFDGWVGDARTESQRFELLTVLRGEGTLRWSNGESRYRAAEMWLLPASLGKYELGSSRQSTAIVRIYVPDVEALERVMAEKGYSEARRRQFIFV